MVDGARGVRRLLKLPAYLNLVSAGESRGPPTLSAGLFLPSRRARSLASITHAGLNRIGSAPRRSLAGLRFVEFQKPLRKASARFIHC